MTLRELLQSSPETVWRIAGNDFTVYFLGHSGSPVYRRSFDDVLRVRTDDVPVDKLEVGRNIGTGFLFEIVER